MTITESIKNYLAKCPILGDFKRLCVDFLPEDTETYSIEEIPAETILRAYIDGSSERQFVFVFAARLFYSEETRNNIENSGLYERFADWLETQTEADDLPVLADGKTATKNRSNVERLPF